MGLIMNQHMIPLVDWAAWMTQDVVLVVDLSASFLKRGVVMSKTVSTKGMRYNKDAKKILTEASSLGWKPGEFPCVVKCRSHRTKIVKVFVRRAIVYDGETGAEVLYIDYAAKDGIGLRVFND